MPHVLSIVCTSGWAVDMLTFHLFMSRVDIDFANFAVHHRSEGQTELK